MNIRKTLAATALAGLSLGGVLAGTAAADTINLVQLEQEAPVQAEAVELVQLADEDDDRRSHRDGKGCGLETAAGAIGISEDDLRTGLDSGLSIAEVAEASGVDPQAVIDAMVDAKAERIADKVESGRITQAQADEKLADLEARMSDRVFGVEDTQGTE